MTLAGARIRRNAVVRHTAGREILLTWICMGSRTVQRSSEERLLAAAAYVESESQIPRFV